MNAFAKGLEIWLENQINGFLTNPVMKKYARNAVHNFIRQQDSEIDRLQNSIMLFVADENGNIDKEQVSADMVKMIASMDGGIDIFGATVTPVKDGIAVDMHNELIRLVFGTDDIKFSDQDLKDLFSELFNHNS